MSSPLTCKSFHDRMCKCYYFKDKNSYVKNATLLFRKVLKKHFQDSTKSFLKVFSETFTYRCYAGDNLIYSNDRKLFKDFCISCAINIKNFLLLNSLIYPQDNYIFNNKIYGHIDGIIEKDNTTIQFSFKNALETQKDLDFYVLNNYIYNSVKKTNYDTIIMSAPTDSYFKVKFDKTDYTIKRGYLQSIIDSKMRRKGDYCLQCSNQCKPTYINKLDRLEVLK